LSSSGTSCTDFSPEQIAELLGGRAALSPGGTVAVWAIRKPEADERPDLFGDAFALFFRLTSTARCSRTDEFTGWLTDAGFVDVQV
jgi:hypothetical protein